MGYSQKSTSNQSQYVKKKGRYRRRRKATAMGLAAKALSVARAANHKELKRLERSESSAITNVDYNGVILNITDNIVQGTTDSSRIGDAIWVKNLHLKGHVNFNGAAAATTEAMVLRMICYYDKSNKINVVGPGVGGYLSIVSTSAAVDAMKYWDSRFETKLIFDKRFTLGRSGDESQLVDIVANINLPVQYNNAGTTVTRGALKFLLISDQSPAATLPEWSFYYRLTYTDS